MLTSCHNALHHKTTSVHCFLQSNPIQCRAFVFVLKSRDLYLRALCSATLRLVIPLKPIFNFFFIYVSYLKASLSSFCPSKLPLRQLRTVQPHYIWINHTKMKWICQKKLKYRYFDKNIFRVMLQAEIHGLGCCQVVADGFVISVVFKIVICNLVQRILGRVSWENRRT